MSTKNGDRCNLRLCGRVAAGSMALGLVAGPAAAIELDLGVPDLAFRWDTTVKYSTAARVKGRSDALLADPNLDDGDRNFGKGLISNRLDLLTEADLTYRNFGARVSGAGWYDRVYRRPTDNDSPGTYNAVSAAFPGYPEETSKIHGKKGELLDAFVFGKFDIGEEQALTVRAGRHTLQWGESLFFGANAIAGGMAPVDVIKALSVPNTQFKDLLRPVKQLSSQFQIRPNLALGAYVQFEWDPLRLPGSGSYFSNGDPAPIGGETLLLGPLPAATRGADVRAKNTGQGGLQLRWRPDGSETDLGFYAIRYHDKAPQLFVTLSPLPLPPGAPPAFVPSQFHFEYAENINAFGFSATHTIDNFNLAAEMSLRTNAPLMSSGMSVIPLLGVRNSYARGQTLHANFSTLASLGPSFVAREAALIAEVAMNHTLKVTENPGAVDPNSRRTGLGMRVVYQPSYRQFLPGLDLDVPVGIGYTPLGRSSAGGGFGPHRGGDMSIGLSGLYQSAWRMSLNYTHYYGPEGRFLDANNNQTFLQTMKDRDFVALSIQRTF